MWRALSRPKQDVWSIAIYTGTSPFDLSPARGIENPVLTGGHVTDVDAAYVADPFMTRKDGTWYMFFEVMTKATRKGDIGYATSRDGLAWEYGHLVLSTSFHLSYPYLFDWNGEYYMLPEAGASNELRLYRAEDFPSKWTLQRTLLEGGRFVDASPFFHDGRWWMFAGTGSAPLHADALRLFHAEELFGPWREHPSSPIITGNAHIARPGGRVLLTGGKVFRFTQDCDPSYGRLVRAFEVTELSERRYAERPVRKEPVLKSRSMWAAMGMHHADVHQMVDGTWLACVDGWRWERLPRGRVARPALPAADPG